MGTFLRIESLRVSGISAVSAVPQYNFYRTYDPNTGRYLEVDPVGQIGGLDLYSYAFESPINTSDPLGLDPQIPHPQSPYIVFSKPDSVDKQNAGVRCGPGGIQVYIPEMVIYGTDAAKCGVLDCYRKHESLHVRDFHVTHPRPCSGAPRNWVPAYRLGARSPLLHRTSEIRAHTAELKCLEEKLKMGCDDDCRSMIEGEIAAAKQGRARYIAGDE